MSIDFSARVDELADFLAVEYRITDRLAIDILLASQLSLPGIPFPWMIIETAWDSLDTTGAWFTFAGILPCGSLNEMRASRPRTGLDRIRQWREISGMGELSLRPLVFVESSFEQPLHGTRAHQSVRPSFVEYKPFVKQFIHLRTPHPKSAANLVLSPARASAKTERFKSLVRSVLDCKFRAPVPAPPIIPPDFLYWCELAYKLAGGSKRVIWETLINQVAQSVLRRAYLYDREVTPDDWSAASRLLADAIPWWTLRTIQCVEESAAGYASQDRAFKYTKEMADLKRANRPAVAEGVLRFERRVPSDLKKVWRVPDDNIYKLAAGHAFG